MVSGCPLQDTYRGRINERTRISRCFRGPYEENTKPEIYDEGKIGIYTGSYNSYLTFYPGSTRSINRDLQRIRAYVLYNWKRNRGNRRGRYGGVEIINHRQFIINLQITAVLQVYAKHGDYSGIAGAIPFGGD